MTSFSERWDKMEVLPASFHPRKFESYTKCREDLSYALSGKDEARDIMVTQWYHSPFIHCALTRKNKIITFYVYGEKYNPDNCKSNFFGTVTNLKTGSRDMTEKEVLGSYKEEMKK